MCKYAISAIYLQKYKKYSEKSDYMDGFCLQSELNLTLFYMIEGYFDNLKTGRLDRALPYHGST